MKITITKQHVLSAQESEGQYNPVELAILDQDMFEEVQTHMDRGQMNLDGEMMPMPGKVLNALANFVETGMMRPMSFDLEIEQPVVLVDEDFFMDEMVSGEFELDLDYNFL